MLGLYPSRQQPRPPWSATLNREIEKWVNAVMKAAVFLPSAGPDATKELFEEHQEGLTELALLLIDYTLQQHHPYNSIFENNPKTLVAAEATIATSRQCAKLFAGYYLNPQAYNKNESANDLLKLLQPLIELSEGLAFIASEESTHKPSVIPTLPDEDDAQSSQRLPDLARKASSHDRDIPPRQLIELLVDKYSEERLRLLAFNLGIDLDILDDRTKRSLARSLVNQAQAGSKYEDLLNEVRPDHPDFFS